MVATLYKKPLYISNITFAVSFYRRFYTLDLTRADVDIAAVIFANSL